MRLRLDFDTGPEGKGPARLLWLALLALVLLELLGLASLVLLIRTA